jgi:hypothetical protein
MKIARIIGLAAIAALVLTASLGAGSALAAETALCKTATISPYCESGDRYAKGTALQTANTTAVFENNLTNVICTESKLEGETTAETGEPLPVTISAWTLAACKTQSGTSCTVSPTKLLPYSSSLSWTTHTNGTLTTGAGAWWVKCGFFVNCTFGAPDLTVHGANPPVIEATEVPVSRSGGICPSTAKFTASYSATTPFIGFVSRGESPPAQTTGLCSEVDHWCESANLYPKGTEIKAESSKLTFENGSYGNGDLTCKKASIAAKTGAAYGEPLPIENTAFALSECAFGNGSACTMTASHLYTGSLSRTASFSGSGSWNGGEASWSQACGFFIKCTFTMPSGSTISVEGQSPAKLKVQHVKLNVSGSTCPAESSMSATFTVSAPNPLFVTDVVR